MTTTRPTFTVIVATAFAGDGSLAPAMHVFEATRATRPAAFQAALALLANAVQRDVCSLDVGGLVAVESLFRQAMNGMRPAGCPHVEVTDSFRVYRVEITRNAPTCDPAETVALATPAPAMVAQPCQQPQADAGAFDGATHAEAAGWLGFVSAHAAGAVSVPAFDAAVTEAVDLLLRRHSITPRVARCLLRFFDAPQTPVVAATVAAVAMVPQPCQQQQCQHSPAPADIGPSVYEVASRLIARVHRAVARKPWSAPVVTLSSGDFTPASQSADKLRLGAELRADAYAFEREGDTEQAREAWQAARYLDNLPRGFMPADAWAIVFANEVA